MRILLLGTLLLPSTSFAQDPTPDDPVAEDAALNPPAAGDSPIDANTISEGDIRGIKPALPVPDAPTSTWPWVLGALASAGLGTGVFAWMKRKKKPLTPIEALRKSLAEATALYESGDHHGHADRTARALRVFIQQTTELPAESMTAEELLTALKPILSDELWTQVKELFTRFDTLRFAGLVEVADDDTLRMAWLEDFITALTAPPEEEAEAPPEQAQA